MGALTLADIQTDMRDWGAMKKPLRNLIPEYAIPVTVLGSAVSPLYGTANQVLILTYTVRANWACLITNIVLGFAGAPPAPLPGDIIWAIDIDRPLGANSGYFEKDYGSVTIPLGDFQQYTWPVQFKHRNQEIIRVKASTVQNVGTGAGNFVTAALIGFEWPEEAE